MGTMIYFDTNATTPLAPEVFAAMGPYFTEHFGNPSSIHGAGRATRAAIDDSRDSLAKILHAKSHEIIFTGGGTEADNLGIIGLARAQVQKGRHIITCVTEHHAVLHAFEFLEKQEGFHVTRLPVDRFGVIDLQALKEALIPETTLVSVMSANNETGTLQPVSEITTICRTHGVLFHSDMIQSFGKKSIDVTLDGPDAISLAAHKFGGPKGVGLLWLRAGIPIHKILHGGFHENERRPGTENCAAIVGMARAAELAVQELENESVRQAGLRDRLWNGIQAVFPAAVMNGHPTARLGNTLNVTFPGLDGECLLINLDLAGICASSGSACMVGSILPSHVLLAMGVDSESAKSTVRFSLGKQNTAEEIETAIALLPKILSR